MTIDMNANKFYPALAGGQVTVPSSGSLTVQTNIQSLHYFNAVLAQDPGANAAHVTVTPVARVPGDTGAKLLIKTWKADGTTPASVAANVSWSAFGKPA